MKKKIIILGGEGNGIMAAATIDRLPDATVLGFALDTVEIGSMIGKHKKIPVVCKTEQVVDMIKNDESVYVFPGYAGVTNPKATYKRLKELSDIIPVERWFSVIDTTAVVPFDYCKIGKGVFISPLSQININAEISDFCKLMGNSFVGHDSFIDEFTCVTTNAVVGSNVKIGKGVHVGSNSVIRERIKVGDYSVIGAGAVVVKDVAPFSVVAGNPAKLLKMRENFIENEGVDKQ